jgi:hypothetical protein
VKNTVQETIDSVLRMVKHIPKVERFPKIKQIKFYQKEVIEEKDDEELIRLRAIF